MAVKITEAIPQQNFELVGEKIGAILTEELANQKVLQSLPEEVFVYYGKITPVSHTEEVVVVVSFDRFGDINNSPSTQQLAATYNIDVYAHAKATVSEKGDSISTKKLERYVGLCRYILQSHKYSTLDFAPGSIMGKTVENTQVYEQPGAQESSYARMCRITFSVRMVENQEVWEGIALSEHTTTVKLQLTEQGYQYKLNV